MSTWPEWKIKDFSEGMVDRVDDNLLPDNAASDCCNFICRYLGRLQKRNGQTRLNGTALGGSVHGLYSYYDDNTTFRKLIAAAGTVVYAWNDTTKAFDTLKTGIDATATLLFETCANYMVGMNGVDAPFKWNGTDVTTLANAPATGMIPTLYENYLFCVTKADQSQLWWADLFTPEVWPAINYWDVKKGDGDNITCMKQFYSDLVIFKNRSIHIFKGSSLYDFRLDEMDSSIGCVGPQAAVVDGTRMYFISQEGLYTFNGLTAKSIHSERIPKLWDGINKEYLYKSVATVWDGLVWFSLPYGTSTTNNLVIVYDPSKGTFWPMLNINASCFQTFDDGTELKLYSGDAVAGYVNQQDVGTEDFGSPVSAYWIGKTQDQNLPEHLKKARKAFIEDSPNQTNPVSLLLSLDYGDFEAWTAKNNDKLIREYRMPSSLSAKWRYITPKFIHNTAGGCEVRGLMLPIKTKAKPKGRTIA